MRLVTRIAGALAAACVAAPVAAADLPSMKAPPSPIFAAPVFTWTGFYAGAQIGHTWGRDVTKEYVTATWQFLNLVNHFKPQGYSLGVHAGANYQMGSFVVGAEADLEWARIRGGFTDPPAPPFNPGGYGRTEVGLQGSLRARLGFAADRLLIYGTGGLAVAQLDSIYTNWGGVSERIGKTVTGYTVGAGAEYAVTDSVSVRFEYRYTDYGLIRNDSLVAFAGFSGTQEPRYNTFRLGASLRF